MKHDPVKRATPLTIEEIQERTIMEFSALADWFDKYEYLVSLGKKLEPLDERFRTDENAVLGCQSQVWVRAEIKEGRLHFRGYSDSVIIRGVLSLLLRTFSGHTPASIASANVHFLKDIGLATHLSPSRANGVATILRHMQQCSAEFSHAETSAAATGNMKEVVRHTHTE